jgi:hypothetical protein
MQFIIRLVLKTEWSTTRGTRHARPLVADGFFRRVRLPLANDQLRLVVALSYAPL